MINRWIFDDFNHHLRSVYHAPPHQGPLVPVAASSVAAHPGMMVGVGRHDGERLVGRNDDRWSWCPVLFPNLYQTMIVVVLEGVGTLATC